MVANRSHAKLYENTGHRIALRAVEVISYPDGRLKNRDINADRPGRSHDSHGQGRHAMSKEVEPTAQLAEQFAKQLAEKLEHGRHMKKYDALVLVAEPRFLGTLRHTLTPATAASVVASLGKDLAHLDERDILEHLKKSIAAELDLYPALYRYRMGRADRDCAWRPVCVATRNRKSEVSVSSGIRPATPSTTYSSTTGRR